jgi:hypothetical protein
MNGSDSRKLWMCCSAGRTSRPPSTADRTSQVAVASCTPAVAALIPSSSGFTSHSKVSSSGTDISAIISA